VDYSLERERVNRINWKFDKRAHDLVVFLYDEDSSERLVGFAPDLPGLFGRGKVYKLAFELARATQEAAIAAAREMGYGEKKHADRRAVEAFRKNLNDLEVSGVVVIGEGERDEAPMLYIGERFGKGGTLIDMAVDPLENTNATASGGNNAIAVAAVSEKGGLFHAPDMYMDKLAVSEEAKDAVSMDYPVSKNLKNLAKALGRGIRDIVVVVLNRPRNEKYIEEIRKVGARIKLIEDGDLSAALAVGVRGSGVHALMGIGAAPEGVISAAGLKCLKGAFWGRFWPVDEGQRERMGKMGVKADKVYSMGELASGKNIIVSATGVTNGDLLKGVRFFGGGARSQTLVMTSSPHYIHFLDTTHVFNKKEIDFRL